MEYEKDILAAESGLKLENATLSDIKKFYRQSRNYIGFSLPETNEDLNDICKSIQQTFRSWRINELLLAVQFSINGIIPSKIATFSSPLTPAHLRDVMQDYQKMKAETILKFKRPQDTETELSQGGKDRIMIEAIERNYRNYLSNPGSLLDDNFFWHHYVHYLKENGLLTYGDDDLKDAKEQAEQLVDLLPAEYIHKLQGRIGKDVYGKRQEAVVNIKIIDKIAWYCILLNYFMQRMEDGDKIIFSHHHEFI